jgi:hypothetical protein
LPPEGVARVAPQTTQLTVVEGRLKIVCSPEQSGHLTTQNGAAVIVRTLLHVGQLERARSPADRLNDVFALLATKAQEDSTNGFGASFWLWPGKASVAPGSAPKPALAPLELGRRLLLSFLDIVRGVLVTPRTIGRDDLGVMHRRAPNSGAYIATGFRRGEFPSTKALASERERILFPSQAPSDRPSAVDRRPDRTRARFSPVAT